MLALKKPQQTHFEMMLKLGLDRTGHMSIPNGQNRTPKSAGQIMLDRTESGLVFSNILHTKFRLSILIK